MAWFHGKITRELAESLLEPREPGLYLVRESTNFPGDYTLCVWYVTQHLCSPCLTCAQLRGARHRGPLPNSGQGRKDYC
jgi:hypothetical protein